MVSVKQLLYFSQIIKIITFLVSYPRDVLNHDKVTLRRLYPMKIADPTI